MEISNAFRLLNLKINNLILTGKSAPRVYENSFMIKIGKATPTLQIRKVTPQRVNFYSCTCETLI